MNHASLFTGLGGFDLAAHWMGWKNIFHCESDVKLLEFLNRMWPYAKAIGDIREKDFTEFKGLIDVLSGGFPCQEFSLAGKGRMDLHLWKEMLRAVREIQPGWVVAENVYGLVVRKRGMALEEVAADLEAEGFTVFPPFVLPAAAAGAIHRRYRVFICAHNNQERFQAKSFSEPNGRRKEGKRTFSKPDSLFETPAPYPFRRVDDGLPGWLDCIAGLGNAVVPQIPFKIFKAIESTKYLAV